MLKKGLLVILFLLIWVNILMAGEKSGQDKSQDYGKKPWVVNIEELTKKNENFRTVQWTGKRLQMTVMSIKPGGEIGLEKHDKGDQFIRIEQGDARVVMGKSKDKMTFDKKVPADWAIFIPAGFWHNIINEGTQPLQVYVIYAPPEHKAGTVHKTFEEAEAADSH